MGLGMMYIDIAVYLICVCMSNTLCIIQEIPKKKGTWYFWWRHPKLFLMFVYAGDLVEAQIINFNISPLMAQETSERHLKNISSLKFSSWNFLKRVLDLPSLIY